MHRLHKPYSGLLTSSLGVKYPIYSEVLCLSKPVQHSGSIFNHCMQNETTSAWTTEKSLLQNILEGGTYLGNMNQVQFPTAQKHPWQSDISRTCPTIFVLPQLELTTTEYEENK